MTKSEIIQAAKDRLAELEAEASSLRAMLLAAGHVPAAVAPWRTIEPTPFPLPLLPPEPPLPYIPPYMPAMPVLPWGTITCGDLTVGGAHVAVLAPDLGALDLCQNGVRFDVSGQRYGAS